MSFTNKLIKKQRNDNFNEWLDKIIEPNTSNKDVVYEMLGEVYGMLHYHGYKIKDTKQFKNEVATYIYKESR